MSVHIDCRGRTILHVKNSVIELLNNQLEDIIENVQFPISENLCLLIKKLEQGMYGIGCDIADFIKNRKDAEIFNSFMKDAMNRYQEKFPDMDQDRRERLEIFYQELVKYAEELKE